jgi:hypothetical protein
MDRHVECGCEERDENASAPCPNEPENDTDGERYQRQRCDRNQRGTP